MRPVALQEMPSSASLNGRFPPKAAVQLRPISDISLHDFAVADASSGQSS